MCLAGLVKPAEAWRFGGLHARVNRIATPPLKPWPVDRPRGWTRLVNEPMAKDELKRMREDHVNRGRPYGDAEWTQRTAKRLALLSTLRPVGRPRKARNQR